MSNEVLVNVKNLSVHFKQGDSLVKAVNGITFNIGRGETVALVGESGSGKSVSALSLMRLLQYPAASHPTGEIWYEGRDILKMKPADLRAEDRPRTCHKCREETQRYERRDTPACISYSTS